MSLFTDGGGRGSLKTAHSDVPFEILRHAALDEESDEYEIGHDGLSEGDIEDALSSDSDSALQAQSNDEKRNFRVSRSGKRAGQRRQRNFPLLPPDARVTEQGACFLPTDHRDTASDDTRQDPSQAPLGWKFCTMNMTAFSFQHLAIFELGSQVCGLQETRLAESGQVWAREVMRKQNWSIVFGQPLEALRSAWEGRPGGVEIAAGPGVELQKAPLVSAHEKAFHNTGRHVRLSSPTQRAIKWCTLFHCMGTPERERFPRTCGKMSCC